MKIILLVAVVSILHILGRGEVYAQSKGTSGDDSKKLEEEITRQRQQALQKAKETTEKNAADLKKINDDREARQAKIKADAEARAERAKQDLAEIQRKQREATDTVIKALTAGQNEAAAIEAKKQLRKQQAVLEIPNRVPKVVQTRVIKKVPEYKLRHDGSGNRELVGYWITERIVFDNGTSRDIPRYEPQ